MIIALNVGNTHVSYATVDGSELKTTGRAPTPSEDQAFRIEMLLDELLGHGGGDGPESLDLVAASVVPAVTAALREVCSRRGFGLLMADERTIPIETRVEAPGTAGHDRLVNAYAAARLHGAPAIVIDLGTATTFDVVAPDGAFLGGAIAPGVGLGVDALAQRTAQLPRVPIVLPPEPIGRNTVEAIQSGTVFGHVGMVTFLLQAMSHQLGVKPTVVLTGGLSAHPWAAAIPGVDAIDPLLTLRGLALLHAEVRRTESVAPA